MNTEYINHFSSPLGEILLSADDIGLTGLWFYGQKFFAYHLDADNVSKKSLPIFDDTKQWLSEYFSGKEPMFTVPLHFIGTDFQKIVWRILLTIPYSHTMTYGEISKIAAKNMCKEHMSPQAVGNAVGRNEISIIVPCHRVLGAKGNLTGYAGGIDKKIKLLEIENIDMEKLCY